VDNEDITLFTLLSIVLLYIYSRLLCLSNVKYREKHAESISAHNKCDIPSLLKAINPLIGVFVFGKIPFWEAKIFCLSNIYIYMGLISRNPPSFLKCVIMLLTSWQKMCSCKIIRISGFLCYNIFYMKVTEKSILARQKNAVLGGRPVGSIEQTTAYKKAVTEFIMSEVHKNKDELVKSMIKKAINGDVTAFKELFDRAMGKAVQGVEHSGVDGQPIVFLPLALIQKHALQIEDEEKPLHIDAKVVQSDTEKKA
jgi:hypothetical protein